MQGASTMRVLIVEDEEHIVKYLAKSLEAEGFVADTAYDGPTGLEKALKGCYDVMTLDIMLPGMNGYDVCKKLRAAGVSTPILMLTAKDGEYDEADALDVGADDFLRKPFSLVVLVARLRALMRRGSSAQGSVLVVGDLRLDQRGRSVSRAGRQIDLTPREYALLECLMINEGRALSKAQLLERVWGPDYADADNLVEVYVGYLRKKIDAPFGEHLIKTVRGVGYKMVEPSEG